MTRKIQISESDLYNIIKQVLIEQEQEKEVWITDEDEFISRLDGVFDGNYEKFTKVHNKHYGKIVVKGNLNLRSTQITSLPDNLYVEGYLNLYNCKNLTSLPDNLHVKDDLNLYGTPIESLPDNLHVGGGLNLYGCKNLTSLPDNLHVEGSLYLANTPIKSLPDNLVVKGTIYINRTPLNDNNELVKEYKAKGYYFYRHQ